jgi:hypothetical protein
MEGHGRIIWVTPFHTKLLRATEKRKEDGVRCALQGALTDLVAIARGTSTPYVGDGEKSQEHKRYPVGLVHTQPPPPFLPPSR